MNHAEEVKKFRFECNRCRSWDKEFMELAENTNFDAIKPLDIFKMRQRVYMNENIEWVIAVMKNHQNTLTQDLLPSKEELAPFYEVEL